MADEIKSAQQQIDRLVPTVQNALRAVAWRYSRLAKDLARSNLLAKIRGHNDKDHQHTADSFVIHEEPERKQFIVAVENPDMPNLAIWLEFGTINMTARPFMRPANDALTEGYKVAMGQAAEMAGVNVLEKL